MLKTKKLIEKKYRGLEIQLQAVTQYSMKRRFGGPQSQSGCNGKEKILFLPEVEPQSTKP
jgi:hypothetical protein